MGLRSDAGGHGFPDTLGRAAPSAASIQAPQAPVPAAKWAGAASAGVADLEHSWPIAPRLRAITAGPALERFGLTRPARSAR